MGAGLEGAFLAPRRAQLPEGRLEVAARLAGKPERALGHAVAVYLDGSAPDGAHAAVEDGRLPEAVLGGVLAGEEAVHALEPEAGLVLARAALGPEDLEQRPVDVRRAPREHRGAHPVGQEAEQALLQVGARDALAHERIAPAPRLAGAPRERAGVGPVCA